MEDALYEIASMRLFAGLLLGNSIPDHTTIMNFHHLLEKHKLARKLFNVQGSKSMVVRCGHLSERRDDC